MNFEFGDGAAAESRSPRGTREGQVVGSWLRRQLFRMKAKSLPSATAFAVPFTLYSVNAKRAVQIRVRRDGFAYFMPQVHVGEQRFEDQGNEIGPFDTPEDAERAAASGDWLEE